MINNNQKQTIIEGIRNWQSDKGLSNAKASKVLGISAAQFSRIMKGETARVLSDDKFLSIARRLEISLKAGDNWQIARTETFAYIMKQLETAQELSTSGLLCDIADIGKTFTAKHYVKTHKNAVYIDCSLYSTKQRFVRKIAQEFGLDKTGRYNDVKDNLIFYLNNAIENPLVILDEAGDLDYPAFTTIKSLWNATEHNVGWYMMGADGLRVKIERFLNQKKVGYAEIFSRFGNKFQRITPESNDERQKFALMQTAVIAKANGVGTIKEIFARSEGSLRRVYHEIKKIKKQKNG